VSWTAEVVATQDDVAEGGIPVSWTATGGLGLGAQQTLTDATGTASVAVQTSGLGGGTSAVITGCAWSTVCAGVMAYGVAPPMWTIAVSGGAGQSVGMSGTLGAVGLQVTDGSGHPLLGATVEVYQTVDAWEGACPAHGPCPAAPVLATSASTVTSDANGMVTVTPLRVPGVPQVVNLAASTGTQGFVAMTLDVTP
jgi:hypothetical protein